VRIAFAALAFCFGLTSQAAAWGFEGHRIIAEIAEQYLKPATAEQVRELLAIENTTTLADVANWADQIRPQRPETAHWHFVNIPIHPQAGTPAAYDPERDCPTGDCVVAKIEEFKSVLRDRNVPARERLEALKFLVHFVGDIHQPLHCSDNNDRGGNAISVEFDGTTTNLHAVWDSGILVPAVKGDERAYALRLARSITPRRAARWRRGSTVDWANESYRIAAVVIYKRLPHTAGILPASYEASARAIVNEQLEKAGIRLAMVLNRGLP
jgi:hypothetical protein